MQNVILTVHLILALLLVGVVLLQRSEGRGGLMGGGDAGVMSGRQAANALTKLTWILALAFIATSITLTILAAADAGSRSVVDQIGGAAPTPEPADSGLSGNLLPPGEAGASTDGSTSTSGD